MPANDTINELVHQIDALVQTAVAETTLEAPELRRVLKFISQVVQVVEQSFQEVLTLLLDIKFLRKDDLNPQRLVELRKNAELLTARSYYRDAAEICSRLKHLSEIFDKFVKPTVSRLPSYTDWQSVFGLIEHREGRIIRLIEESAREIDGLLERVDANDLSTVQTSASLRIEELRSHLKSLHDLNGRILGLSGGVGFLELTANRGELQRELRIMIDQRDQSVTHGHRVSTGAGTVINGQMVVATTIQDSFKTISESGVSKELQAELKTLCTQVEAMLLSLPEDRKHDVQQDLASFVTETTKESPRKKWYELSAEGLIEAAKACAGVASPVIITVKKIVDLLA